MKYKGLISVLILVLMSMNGYAQKESVAEGTQDHVRLNALSLTVYGLAPVAVYERIIPFSSKIGMIGSVGGFYYGDPFLGFTLGATVYVGSPIHKFEAGAAHLNKKLTLAYGAYRFVGKKGLFAKAGLGYPIFHNGDDAESSIVPVLALGYAF